MNASQRRRQKRVARDQRIIDAVAAKLSGGPRTRLGIWREGTAEKVFTTRTNLYPS